MGWTLDPAPLAAILVVAVLYGRRARTLGQRGHPVPRLRLLSFAAGLAALVLALVSPLDTIGESRLFSVHMLQHLVIGDVVPILLVLGLTGPLLRPVLALPGADRMRVLASPLVALPLWAASLWLWHLPFLYDAALRHDAVHALEHLSFLACGLLLWTSLLGLLPGPRWYTPGRRLTSLAFVLVAGGVLANVFLWSGRAHYGPYLHAPRTWGLSPLDDQRAGGGVMLVEMMLVGSAVFIVIGLHWLADAERRQVRRDVHARLQA